MTSDGPAPGRTEKVVLKPAPQNVTEVFTPEQHAVLTFDVDWLAARAVFRKRMVEGGFLKHRWRSVFEADMIFSIIGLRWFAEDPITLKELALHFEYFVTEVTVSRHIDDMEAAGTVLRQPDPKDRRRLLLVPTEHLGGIGKAFLQHRVDILRANGFVYDPDRAAAEMTEQLK